jgi:O-acetyl-ADP-ribose deacetylase (regulator of RNase III)
MISSAKGNLLDAQVEALVNTVNTEGVMGKGIALQFKQAYPAMFREYEHLAKAERIKLGTMHIFDLGGLVGGPRWIVNFPTKGHWRAKSRLSDIEAGLKDLVRVIREHGIQSIALPPLGCGHGGLNWGDVLPLIEKAFAATPDVDVRVYAPLGTPAAADMPNRTPRPLMTEGRAALIGIMDRYLKGLLDPVVTLLEVHKLLYFMQEAGQLLKLKYVAGDYGPYAGNLRQVLIRLEKHFTQGYGDGSDIPTKPIELLPGAVAEAETFLRQDEKLRKRMDRVSELIDGYESPYGLELLSSVHWVMQHYPDARESSAAAASRVREWNIRKRKIFKEQHLEMAWHRLKDAGWGKATAPI